MSLVHHQRPPGRPSAREIEAWHGDTYPERVVSQYLWFLQPAPVGRVSAPRGLPGCSVSILDMPGGCPHKEVSLSKEAMGSGGPAPASSRAPGFFPSLRFPG